MNWLIVLLYTVALGDYIVFLLVIFINYSNDHYFVSFQIVLSRFESILDRRNCCKSETFEKNRRDEDDFRKIISFVTLSRKINFQCGKLFSKLKQVTNKCVSFVLQENILWRGRNHVHE